MRALGASYQPDGRERAWIFNGAQAAVAFLFNPTGGLLPLGLILFLILSIPSMISATIGGLVGRRVAGRGPAGASGA